MAYVFAILIERVKAREKGQPLKISWHQIKENIKSNSKNSKFTLGHPILIRALIRILRTLQTNVDVVYQCSKCILATLEEWILDAHTQIHH